MQRLNPFRLYDIGAKLHALVNCTERTAANLFSPITESQKVLDNLIKGDPIELVVARGPALQLQNAVSNLFEKYYIDPSSRQLRMPGPETQIDPQDILILSTQLQQFDQALAADLSRTISYRAEQRGIYSTRALMENASAALPPTIRGAVPENARHEMNEAGRCLGFGLAIAATAHLMRAVEITTAQYYLLFGQPVSTRAERNLASYLRKLQNLIEDGAGKTKPEQRTVALLQQIKDRYRNPLIDAEAQVSIDEALLLFSMATSAMAEMGLAIVQQNPQQATLLPEDVAQSGDMAQFLAEEQHEAYDQQSYGIDVGRKAS